MAHISMMFVCVVEQADSSTVFVLALASFVVDEADDAFIKELRVEYLPGLQFLLVKTLLRGCESLRKKTSFTNHKFKTK